MSKLILLAVLVFLMAGCGKDKRTEQGAGGELSLTTYRLKGVDLECVSLHAYSSSCSWEKYNKAVKND